MKNRTVFLALVVLIYYSCGNVHATDIRRYTVVKYGIPYMLQQIPIFNNGMLSIVWGKLDTSGYLLSFLEKITVISGRFIQAESIEKVVKEYTTTGLEISEFSNEELMEKVVREYIITGLEISAFSDKELIETAKELGFLFD